MVPLFDEYKLKIDFSDQIKKMIICKKNSSHCVSYCKALLFRLARIYHKHSELKFIGVYLCQIEKTKENNQTEILNKINILFDYFIAKLKKNSFMEVFLYDSETEDATCSIHNCKTEIKKKQNLENIKFNLRENKTGWNNEKEVEVQKEHRKKKIMKS